MRRIIYQSVAAPELDRAALFRLVYQARVANEQRGLSGFLIFADQRFLQVLEGPTWKLVATFEAIRRDVRHYDVTVIDERTVEAPLSGSWRMRCFDEGGAGAALDAIVAEAGGPVPRVVEDAVAAFFGCDRARANLLRMHPV
jgi:hypothetical protein